MDDDWPHYYGRWEPAGEPVFEEAFRVAQAGLAAGEVVVWDAAFRTPGGSWPQPVRLVVLPGRPAPRLRFGGPGQPAG